MSSPSFLKLKFAKAIAYFRRKVPIPTERWNQFEAEQHDYAFTIAGLTRADLLSDAQYLIDRAIAEGTSLEDFTAQFQRLIGRKGWQPKPLPAGPVDWRMRIIFETNIRRAYSAGRHEQLNQPELMAARPYRMWTHGNSPDPRPSHLALNGKVFKATDNKFWSIVGAGNCAYGCKCRVYSLSERDVKRMGKTISKPPDPNTIAEPGFRRAPGTTPESDRKKVLKQGIDRLSPELKAKVEADLKTKVKAAFKPKN